MGFLIGGLSPNQYHTYLSASSRVEAEKIKGVAAFFKFSSYPALAVLINRLAYFILNCFKAYPNDTYLFEKFKSHQFTAMKAVEEYQAAKEIFKRFQKCPELKTEDVAQVKQDLKDLKKIVSPKPISHTPEPIAEGVDQRKEDQIEKENNQENPVKSSVDINLREENLNIEQEKGKPVEGGEKKASVEEGSAETEQKKDEVLDSDASSEESSATVEPEVREDVINSKKPGGDTSSAVVSEVDTKEIEEETEEDEWLEDEGTYRQEQQKILTLLAAESDKKEIEDAANIDAKKTDDVEEDAKGPADTNVGTEAEEKTDHVEEEVEGSGDTETEVKTEVETEVVEEELETEENAGAEADLKEEIEEESPKVEEMLSPHVEAVKLYMQEAKTIEELLAAMQTLENKMANLLIVPKIQAYQTAKEEHAENESKKWFYEKAIPFNDVAHSVPHTDVDDVISNAETLLKYSVKARQLELTKEQVKEFKRVFNAIRNELINIQKWLDVVNRDTKEANYEDKKQQLQLILTTLAAEVGIVIGENAEKDVSYPKWKISRYEALISGTKTNIVNYFNKLGFDMEILALKSLDTQPKDWLVQLKPILLFCRQTVRKDEERFDQSYAEVLSQAYVTFIGNLRKAEEWAASHPKEVGAEHIHALCYQFYVMLEMNQECQEIVDTFVEKTLTPQNIPNNDILAKYKLLERIYQIRYSIQYAPEEITSPRLMNRSMTFMASPKRGFQQLARAASTTRVADSNTQSNFANLILQKILTVLGKGQKHVKELGMGAPIIESGFTKKFSNKVVNSEFKGFLSHCERNGLKHLYVSTLTGKNSDYHPVIQKLEEEFKGVFFALKLSQDSFFYQQKGHQISDRNIEEVIKKLKADVLETDTYVKITSLHPNKKEELNSCVVKLLATLRHEESKPPHNRVKQFDKDEQRDSFIQSFHDRLREEYKTDNQIKFNYSIYDYSLALFKPELVDQMFNGSSETGNYISQGLVNQFGLRAWSTMMVEQIHQKMFGGKDNLSIEERRIFIRLFYQNLMQKVLLETGVDSYNISCEKGCDQAAATQAEEFAYLAILNNCTNDPEVIKTFETNLFARAVIVNKSSIDEGCLERTIETVKFMLDNQDQLKALHAELFPNVQMTTDQFPVEEEEEAEEVVS